MQIYICMIGKNCLFKKSNPFTLSQLVLIPESYEFLRDYDFMMCQMPHMLTQSYICNCEPEKASGSERNQWFQSQGNHTVMLQDIETVLFFLPLTFCLFPQSYIFIGKLYVCSKQMFVFVYSVDIENSQKFGVISMLRDDIDQSEYH